MKVKVRVRVRVRFMSMVRVRVRVRVRVGVRVRVRVSSCLLHLHLIPQVLRLELVNQIVTCLLLISYCLTCECIFFLCFRFLKALVKKAD